MRWLRDLLHAHHDPDYRLIGVNVYYICRCGARRVRRAYSTLLGPIASGWPRLVDRHGFPRDDSGWERGDWTGGYPDDRPARLPAPPPGPGAGGYPAGRKGAADMKPPPTRQHAWIGESFGGGDGDWRCDRCGLPRCDHEKPCGRHGACAA